MKNNYSESERNLEIENKELRKKLAAVTKEFNDYKYPGLFRRISR